LQCIIEPMVKLPTLQPLAVPDSGIVQVFSFAVGPLRCNCSIVSDPISKQAIVIDPGGDANKILALLNANHLTVIKIVHTHAHFDHFMASGQLRESTEAPLALHPADVPLWNRLEEQCARYGLPYTPVPPPDDILAHEETLYAGQVSGTVLHTPGHTPGSCCFMFNQANLLLSGDTLFKQSVGRTDLWGGNFDTLKHSIQTRLYTLDEGLTVVPGHGPQTVLGHEMHHNPHVRALVA
jgi:hydroxyacylglutathione hydrolase